MLRLAFPRLRFGLRSLLFGMLGLTTLFWLGEPLLLQRLWVSLVCTQCGMGSTHETVELLGLRIIDQIDPAHQTPYSDFMDRHGFVPRHDHDWAGAAVGGRPRVHGRGLAYDLWQLTHQWRRQGGVFDANLEAVYREFPDDLRDLLRGALACRSECSYAFVRHLRNQVGKVPASGATEFMTELEDTCRCSLGMPWPTARALVPPPPPK